MEASTPRTLLILALALPGTAAATDRWVCAVPGVCSRDAECLANPATCYTSVGAALTAAAGGDTIWLSDETYDEVISKDGGASPITIIGEGPTLSVIRGNTGADSVTLKNFTVTVQSVGFTTPPGVTARRCLRIDNATATLTDVRISDCEKDRGSGLEIKNNSVVAITDSAFAGNIANSDGKGGPDISITSGIATITDTTFDGGFADNNAAALGGSIALEGGTLVLIRGAFTNARTTGDGGAISAEASTELVVEGTVFDGNIANAAGGAIWADQATVTVQDAWFLGNDATSGGAISASDMNLFQVSDSTFQGNVAEAGGAIAVSGSENFEILRSLFCGNFAAAGALIGLLEENGGALLATSSSGALRNLVFLENQANAGGGAIAALGGTVLDSANNDYVGNGALLQAGAGLARDATILSVDDLYLGNVSAVTDVLYRAGTGTLTVDTVAFWGNVLGNTNAQAPTNLILTDPLVSWTAGDCSATNLARDPASPLIDADPLRTDSDGSDADIGAQGGPGGDGCIGAMVDSDSDGIGDGCDPCPLFAGESDGDGDGYWICDDCDDVNPAVNPGATEIPGNGLDDDCVGGDTPLGTTGTGTGVGTGTGGGTGGTASGGTGTGAGTGGAGTGTGGGTGTGIGRDYDATPDTADPIPSGCGCDAGGAGRVSGAWLGLVLAIGLRRRR